MVRTRFEIYMALPMRKVETMRPPAAIVDEILAALMPRITVDSRLRAPHSSSTQLAMSGSGALLAWPQLALVATFAPASRTSSIFLRRIVGSMFMRVNSKCAHQVRPPLTPLGSGVRVARVRLCRCHGPQS